MPTADESLKKIAQQLMTGQAPIILDIGDGKAILEHVSLLSATLASQASAERGYRETLKKAREVVNELLPARLRDE